MMRVGLYLATNFAVLLVFGIITNVFQLDRLLGLDGANGQFLIYAALMGFAGSFISLAMSKSMAKRSMGVHVIEQPTNETERWLVATVQKQAEQAGVGMPEVGIFDSPSPNAFATGMSKNSALVAVSSGLLASMSKEEVEAVLGHEMAHVYNGDMVAMALIQGVLNTFVFFFARMLGMLLDRQMSGGQSGGGYRHGMGYWIGNLAGQFVFGILASFIAAWFSRQREYRADAGGAELAGKQNMIGALRALQRGSGSQLPERLAAFGITGSRLSALRATHPPLEVRIQRLQSL